MMRSTETKRFQLLAVAALLLSASAGLVWRTVKPGSATAAAHLTEADIKARVVENYGKLPLAFEPNRGQADQAVQYLSHGDGYMLFLTKDGATLALQRKEDGKRRSTQVQLQLVGANAQPQTEALDQLQGKANYLIGNDRAKWHTDIPTYRKVQYREVWPGVDMVWYGSDRRLEYDFIVKPNAVTDQIKLRFAGAESLRLDEAGNLVLQTKGGDLTQPAPVIYQEGAQGRETVAGKYVLTSANEVAFELGAYDTSRVLVIDPQLVYSSYFGGASGDVVNGIAVDTRGRAYLTGPTFSTNLPVLNALQRDYDNFLDVFIVRMNAAGNDREYCTYLGTRHVDEGFAIAAGSDGKAYVTGSTQNANNLGKFPVTENRFQGNGSLATCGVIRPCRNVDAFLTVLTPDGSQLFYSTYYGGSGSYFTGDDSGLAIALDAAGKVYVAGVTDSFNLPTKNAFQDSRGGGQVSTKKDAFIAKFDPTLSGDASLLYASYLGGDKDDVALGVAVDNVGNAYIGGKTESDDLETKAPAGQSLPPLQATFRGGTLDGFVAKVDTEASGASSLTYLTYFGGSGNDRVNDIAVDSAQRAYITGSTGSAASSFPLLNAFDNVQNNGEAFVAKLNANGTTLFYCSFLGGTNATGSGGGFEEARGIALDQAENVYLTGITSAGATFPLGAVAPPFPANQQGTAFVAKIAASVSTTTPPVLLYASTFGGSGTTLGNDIALDPRGNVYLTGETSGGFPVTAGAFQTIHNGLQDGFVTRIGSTFADSVGVFRPANRTFLLDNPGGTDLTVTFGQSGDIPVTGDWDGDGDDEPGVFRPSVGQFILRNLTIQCSGFPPSCTSSTTSVTVFFGLPGDLPVVGDWNGDGIDTPGVFRPSTLQFLLTDGINGQNVNNSNPLVDDVFSFGILGDLPVAGDWNADGLDTVGVYRQGAIVITDVNDNFNANEARVFSFGIATDLPVAGDWNGDGVDTIGVFRNGTGFVLTNRLANFDAAEAFTVNFGQAGDLPLAGDWDRVPVATVAAP